LPNIRPSAGDWPRSLDDLRSEPGRLVLLSDLAKLGMLTSYSTAARKRLGAPYRLPNGRPAWEARAVLAAIGAAHPQPKR
jgi:hypothetical protein